MTRDRALEWTAVGAGFLVLVVVAGAWLALDRRPPEWDYANHLERAVLCAGDLAHGDLSAALARSTFYPPLVPCTAGMAYRLVPSDASSAQAVVLAFLGVGMAATYLLGRRFAGGTGGVVAALVFGSTPFVVRLTLRFQLDLPLAAMVALALEVLLRAEGFSHRGWSLVTGVVVGLGLLTKPTFVAYVMPPLLLVLARSSNRRAFANGAIAGVVAGALAVPWYGPRLLGMWGQISARSFKQAAEVGQPDPFSAAGLLYYPTLFAVQLGAVGVILFLIGLAITLRRHGWFLLAALCPLVIFFLIQNKDLRYTLPLLPAAAVVSGVGFAALGRLARVVAGAAVVLVGALQVSTGAFGLPRADHLALGGVPLALETSPLTAAWPHREILARIARESPGVPVTVSVVPNHPYFSVSNFRYFALREGLALRVVRAWDEEPLGVRYMILKTGDIGPPWTADKPRHIAARLADDQALVRMYPVIGEFPLPDGSVATVRARRIPEDLDASPARLARAVESGLKRRLEEMVRDVDGLEVSLAYDRAILHGQIAHLDIRARAATLGDFRRRKGVEMHVHDLAIALDDVVVNPFSALAAARFDPLDVGRFTLARATITAEDIRAFVASQKGLRGASVSLEPDAVAVRLPQLGTAVSGRVHIVPAADRPFALIGEDVHLGGVPLPGRLVDWVIRNYDPSAQLASRAPFPIAIGRVRVSPDAIRILPK